MFQRFLVSVIFLMVCFPVLADEDVFNLAGAGAVISTSPYAGVDAKTTPVPFLIGEYKDFYVKGIEAGYHFLKTDPWTLSVVASPRFMGYSSDDSTALNGMEDREMSLDAGIRAKYALPWQEMSLEAKVLTDTLSRNDGSEFSVGLGREIKGGIYRFSPSVGVRYQDKAMVDYYYGVRSGEVRSGRQAYAPHGAVNPYADAVFSFGIAERLIVVTRFGVEALGADIRKSPLVDENYIFGAAAGLTYRF